MIHLIGDILTASEIEALSEAAAALPFEDGRRTAGALARSVKNNVQAAAGPERDAVLRKVQAALMANPTFCSIARPKGFARLLVSRYVGGQAYGLYVDDALMDGARTDVSFTLCISAPDQYQGGALLMSEPVEDRVFRPGAGEAIVYPSTTLHRVEPVTDGMRLAVVGWATSWVRDPEQRAVLHDLDQAVAAEQASGGDAVQLGRLARSRSNLIRMWAQ